jgi:hypothetical protein
MWNSFSDELFFSRLEYIVRRILTLSLSNLVGGREGMFVLIVQIVN